MTAGRAAGARPRLLGSDALRVTALVGVVMIHASAWAPTGGGNSVFAAVNLISRFSVPVFMVLTGLVLGYQYANRPLGPDFIRRRASRTVVPWLAWVPVYLLFDIFAISTIHRTPSSIYTWLNQGTGHLWYLLLVPQMYILFALWPRRRAWLLVAPALALQTFLCVVRVYGPIPGGLEQLVLVHGFELFPFWVGYFAIGVALGRVARPGATTAHRGWLIALAAAGVIGGGYLLLNFSYAGARYAPFVQGTGAFLNPVLPFVVLTISALLFLAAPPLMRRSTSLPRAVRTLSDLSLGVYIIHPIPLYGIGRLWGPYLGFGRPLAFLPLCALVVLSIVAGAIVTRLIAATPLAVTVGMRRQPLHLDRLLPAGRDAARAG
jgi:peptidoglycan/LPS O-acetylase OafA/YrhL